MKIGITGSVGFLGANLVKYFFETFLPENGAELIPFYSSKRSNPLTEKFSPNYIHMDITNAADVLEKTRGLDALFHVAGSVDFGRRNLRRSWELNVLGSRNVFEAAMKNGIKKLVYVSSINVIGDAGGKKYLTENDSIYDNADLNPNLFRSAAEALKAVESSMEGNYSFLSSISVPYWDSKLAAYELARKYAREGLPVVTVFPGTIVGSGDNSKSIASLVNKIYHNTLHVSFGGTTSFVTADDAAKGVWLAFEKGRTGEGYIISGPEEMNIGYVDFMKRVAAVCRKDFGKKSGGPYIVFPRFINNLATKFAEFVAPRGELTRGLYLSGTAHQRFSVEKARRELGYNPSTPLEKGIRDAILFNLEYIYPERKESQRIG